MVKKQNSQPTPESKEQSKIATLDLTKLSLDKLNKVMGSGGGVGTGGTGSYSIAQKSN